MLAVEIVDSGSGGKNARNFEILHLSKRWDKNIHFGTFYKRKIPSK